ncbi:target of EGR1 protein 1-like isoform X2 [Liolophura sinensis]
MRVPVIDVNSENLTEVWPSLVLAVKSATFVALDTELSGLGDRKWLNAKCVEERYKAISHIANTRAIVSLGISAYKFLPSTQEGNCMKGDKPCTNREKLQCDFAMKYMVQTFNISVLCQQDYVVEAEALRFLVDHGFDFNKQYSQGIPYDKGEDMTKLSLDKPGIRSLFAHIILSQVPVVFHNAFVDLGFLYENLYATLPASLGTFVSDISEIFEAGVYDTKYISEFVAHFPASYLDYVFHKSLRENSADGGCPHVELTFPKYPAQQTSVTYRSCTAPDPSRPLPHPEILKVMRGLVCDNFASHGWCIKRRECTKSHDIDLILDCEDVVTKKRRRYRKRKHHCEEDQSTKGAQCLPDTPHSSTEVMNSTVECRDDQRNGAEAGSLCKQKKMSPEDRTFGLNGANADQSEESKEPESREILQTISEKIAGVEDLSKPQAIYTNGNKGHRAGFDAFMTGFAMATFVARYGSALSSGHKNKVSLSDWGLEELVNKVCLSGKSIPMIVTKSSYCKTSKQHTEKLEILRSLPL